MNINNVKRELIDEIIGIDDEQLLHKIQEVISLSDSKPNFKVLTENEMIEIMTRSVEDYEKGRVTSQSELELEIKSWKNKH